MDQCDVFHSARNSLGEGLFVDREGDRVFWVDIIESHIYQKPLGTGECRSFDVGRHPSTILAVDGSSLLFINRDGVCSLDLETGEQATVSPNPDTNRDKGLRANDGVALANGHIIYGTMRFDPDDRTGGLFRFDGEATRSLDIPIGIPNGFVQLSESEILIADSFTGHINLYKFDETGESFRFTRCWHDFSSDCFTPDGGCTDYNGMVYFALWDGSGIAVLDNSGNLVEIVSLPVPRPTNCKLAGEKRLLVTTARDGLTRRQLNQAPSSGSVLDIKFR